MEPQSSPIQPQISQPVIPQSEHSNKLLFVMIGISTLLILAAGSLYFIASQKKEVPTVQTKQLIQPTTQVQPSQPVADEFAGWKTYTSSDGLFSFQYPKNQGWIVTEKDDGNFNNRKQIGISCYGCNQNHNGHIDLVQIYPIIYSSSDEYLKNNSYESDITKTEFNGLPAIKSVQSGSEQVGGSYIEEFFVYNGQGYIIDERFEGLLYKTKLSDFPSANPNIFSTIKLLK